MKQSFNGGFMDITHTYHHIFIIFLSFVLSLIFSSISFNVNRNINITVDSIDVIYLDIVFKNEKITNINDYVDSNNDEYISLLEKELGENEILASTHQLIKGDTKGKILNDKMKFHFESKDFSNILYIIAITKDKQIHKSETLKIEAVESNIYFYLNDNHLKIQDFRRNITVLIIFMTLCLFGITLLFSFIFHVRFKEGKILFVSEAIMDLIYSMLTLNALFLDGLKYCIFTIILIGCIILIIRSLIILLLLKQQNIKKRILLSFSTGLSSLLISLFICFIASLL